MHTEEASATSLSTLVTISVKLGEDKCFTVGAIKNFSVSQDRQLRREEVVDEETGKIHVNLIPGHTQITINLERAVFDGLSITEAFGHNFRLIELQELSFDILVEDIVYINHVKKPTITTYHNCLFSHMGSIIKADDYVILEHATILCETISSQKFL